MKALSKTLLLGISTLLLAGCASTARFPDNPPLTQAEQPAPAPANDPDNNSIILVLSFSGGGSRASALAYGVLDELAETPLNHVTDRRMLDEVDMISAVSGGSITAAYYGLFGDRLFEDFRERFLERDAEAEIKASLLEPGTLARLSSPSFGSGDVLDEYFRRQLFGDAPLDQLIDGEGPLVEINATDIFKGGRFGFIREQFGLICSDSRLFPAARAVAASCAVPLLFSPVTLNNRAGSCNFIPPPWMYDGLNKRGINNRLYRRAVQYSTYLDSENHPYIHLLDGGLADNLGLRAVIDRVIESGGMWETLKRFNQQDARHIVMIAVDASSTPPSEWERSANTPPTKAILDAATTTPLANYSFETLEYLRSHIDLWSEEIRQGRCTGQPECTTPEFYLIEIQLEDIAQPDARERLTRIPTGFNLQPGVAAELITTGKALLKGHPEYHRLLHNTQSP
ncbi:MAG: patatin-like phospholipase family protein [Candidatus Sedimenticola sp. 20ELBAFRAG]